MSAVEVRVPVREDAEAILEAINARSQVLHGRREETLSDVLSWFDAPNLDTEQDLRVAVLDGTVVGYADVTDRGEEHRSYWLDIRVGPGFEDAAGDPLLDALERRSRETAEPDAILRGLLAGEDEAMRRFFVERGFELIRHSLRMQIEFDGPPPAPEWPDGVAVRQFEPGRDEEAVYEASEEAFEDHWEYVRNTYDEWRHWSMREPFDPSLWFLAVEGGEIAGVCLCRPHETGDTDLGWVQTLGVRRPWRRRGLGQALLRHALREFHARGKPRAGLGVDAENTTGAVRLYERAGMSISRRYDIVDRPL